MSKAYQEGALSFHEMCVFQGNSTATFDQRSLVLLNVIFNCNASGRVALYRRCFKCCGYIAKMILLIIY